MKITIDIPYQCLSEQCKKDIAFIMERTQHLQIGSSERASIESLLQYGCIPHLARQARLVAEQEETKIAVNTLEGVIAKRE